MERKSLTYFKALICAFGLVLAGSPPGMVFAKENDTKQEASAGSGGSVYRATDAKDMAEHVSVVNLLTTLKGRSLQLAREVQA